MKITMSRCNIHRLFVLFRFRNLYLPILESAYKKNTNMSMLKCCSFVCRQSSTEDKMPPEKKMKQIDDKQLKAKSPEAKGT